MDTIQIVLPILDEVLNLRGAALDFTRETKLRGAIPQLDSMAVVSLLAALEEQLGVEIPESQLDGSIFETVGTLVSCIERVTGQAA